MKDIVQWLRQVEGRAEIFYTKASELFADDPALRQGLKNFADDEAWHFRAMTQAAEHLKDHEAPDALITNDPETEKKVAAHFRTAFSLLETGALTRRQLYDFVINTEFSEWNDMFQYVVNTLKGTNPYFKEVAVHLQAHKRAIAYFLEQLYGADDTLQKAKELPPVWTEKILIIEDDEAIAELIMAVIEGEGEFHVAADGKTALEMIKATYFKLIISDVNMPVMNGLTCYRQASELFPNIRDRYLFITGDFSEERIAFFKAHQVAYLKKPVPISDIRKAAMQILLRQTLPPLKPMASPIRNRM